MGSHMDQAERKWEELIQRLVRGGILRTPSVIRALRRVPREPFIPESSKGYTAVDSPLPIGFGQTISAPLD